MAGRTIRAIALHPRVRPAPLPEFLRRHELFIGRFSGPGVRTTPLALGWRRGSGDPIPATPQLDYAALTASATRGKSTSVSATLLK